MQTTSFEEVLEEILKRDARYHREAFHFVRESLDYTQKLIGKGDKKIKHVSGQELLDGIREYALQQYGPMAITVFEEWGVRACRDFGEIVFLMVEHNILAKTEKDSRTDFDPGYDFDDAFRKPFLPQEKPVIEPAPAKTTSV